MEDTELREKVAHLEEREKSNTHRIDNLEEKVEDIHELASSTKLLASEVKAMREDVSDMNSRLKILEEKPLREYEDTKKQVKSHVISYITNIILAIAVARTRIIKIFIKKERNDKKC